MTNQPNNMTAEVLVPLSKDAGGPTRVEEIPLPPPELWEELDNSGETEAAPEAQKLPEPEPVKEIAVLDFVTSPFKHVTLDFPFRLNGSVIDTLTVRRMRTGEVDRFLRQHPNGFSTTDVYAAMVGLTPDVLRGLIAEDGEKITDACIDFLAPAIRRAFDSPES